MTKEEKEVLDPKATWNMTISQNPAIVAAAEAARTRIQSAYLVAMNRPRNVDEARDKILKACRRPIFAERVEYEKPVGGKKIRGPSVRFAETAIKEWGNIMTESQIIYEDSFVKRIKVIITDLETNATHSKEIQIDKTVERKDKAGREVMGERLNTNGERVYIVKATEDELHNKEAANVSKAIRNEGLRLIPSDIIDEAISEARKTMQARDKTDPEAARKKILDSFSSIGVSPSELTKYVGKSLEQLNPAELGELRSIYAAIKDGDARWQDYISKPESPLPKDETPPEPGTDPYKIKEAPKVKTVKEATDELVEEIEEATDRLKDSPLPPWNDNDQLKCTAAKRDVSIKTCASAKCNQNDKCETYSNYQNEHEAKK